MVRAALLAIFVVAGTAAANAQEQQKTRDPLAEIRKSPLHFYVAHGDENSCGPGCSEWIAAEGFFDSGAPARLRKFLATTKTGKLPIFFESGGGLQQAAEAIGGIMRERAMTAGVAKTIPEECVLSTKDTHTCSSVKKSGKKVKALWSSVGAACNSACVYALIGAKERRVPLGGRLGVHAVRAICRNLQGFVDSRDTRCAQLQSAARAQIAKYVSKMGVDPKLTEAAEQIPHEKVRYLSREEIALLGIDRSEAQESPWMVATVGPAAVMTKYVIEGNDVSGNLRWGALQVQCPYFGTLYLRFFRLAARREDIRATDSVGLTVNGHRYVFPGNTHVARHESIDPTAWTQMRQLWLPLNFIDPTQLTIEILNNAATTPSVAIILSPSLEAASRKENEGEEGNRETGTIIRPSTDGFLRAWKVISSSCPSTSEFRFEPNFKPVVQPRITID